MRKDDKKTSQNKENIVDREEEVKEKVKLWREQMTEKILSLAHKQEDSLDKDIALLSAVLKCIDKGLDMGIECESIQIFLLNHGLRNLISDKNAWRSGVQSLENQGFKIGNVSGNFFDLFGKLIDETEETSSDIYHKEEREEGEEDGEEHNDDIFYDSLDLKMSMKFKFCLHSIVNIVPLGNSKTLILIDETVYDCDVKKRGVNPQLILSNVLQITLIPSCGDVLLLMTDRKCIKRIASGKLQTTYAKTNDFCELYYGVGPAGKEAYACLAHDKDINSPELGTISLLDEYGRILMSVSLTEHLYSTCRIFFVLMKETNFF